MAMIRALILMMVGALVLACPTPTASAEDVVEDPPMLVVRSHSYEPLFENPPSIEGQIFDSDTSSQSATADAKNQGTNFVPSQVLQFRSSEYLKGTGPATFVVEVTLEGAEYSERADALAEAQALIDSRNTTYDSRPGVLFLQGPLSSSASGSGNSSRSASSSPQTTYGFIPSEMDIQP